MRKAINGFEDSILLCIAIASFLAAAGTALLRSHLHIHNHRVQYGMEHLPAALLAVCLFTLLTGLLRIFLVRSTHLLFKPSIYYLGFLTAVFGLCWLPALLAGGFVQDDWMLLAAASVRKVIYLHPAYSWYTLDSVDGNFRPLGTVLYFGYMLKWFGLSAFAFLSGSFLINLLGSLVAFGIVREMDYSKVAGAAASILYMSRGLTYTINTWASALGDGLVILLCGLMALAILKANKLRGPAAFGYHAMAWISFFFATLAKQSSFAAPVIVVLLLFLRPGETSLLPLGRRIKSALLGLLVYSGTAAVVFFHAKALSQAKTPYPIAFSVGSVLQTFSYPTWYVMTFEFPDKYVAANLLSRFVGLAIVFGLIVLAWKVPRLLGERPRDILFAVLAAIASLSLFVFLATRIAPYYGSMFAFWISIALGITLTRFELADTDNRPARLCCLFFCLLAVTGFADIRIKQTGLIPAGGYIWGTFGMNYEREQYRELQRQLARWPQKDVLVLADPPSYPSYYTAMALLADPGLKKILVYDSTRNAFFSNDLEGDRPRNDFGALNDPLAYNWTVPMKPSAAADITSREKPLWLEIHDSEIEGADRRLLLHPGDGSRGDRYAK